MSGRVRVRVRWRLGLRLFLLLLLTLADAAEVCQFSSKGTSLPLSPGLSLSTLSTPALSLHSPSACRLPTTSCASRTLPSF